MEFKTLYKINNLNFKFSCGAINTRHMPHALLEGWDWRNVTSGTDVYCGFVFLAQSNLLNSAGELNIVIFHKTMNGLQVNGPKSTYRLLTPEVQKVFGTTDVYASIIQANTKRVTEENYLIGGTGNYYVEEIEDVNKNFTTPPTTNGIYPSGAYNTITMLYPETREWSIYAEPNENGFYFPIYVEKDITNVEGNNFKGIVEQWEQDTETVKTPNKYNALSFKRTAVGEIIPTPDIADRFLNYYTDAEKPYKTVSTQDNVEQLLRNIANTTVELNSFLPIENKIIYNVTLNLNSNIAKMEVISNIKEKKK